VRSTSRTWIWSLTGVCFIFGMLMALQINQQTRMQDIRAKNAQYPIEVQNELKATLVKLKKEQDGRLALQNKVNELQKTLATTSSSSDTRAKQLMAQTRDLQLLAGMTAITGEGLTVTMTDNPEASKTGGDTPFLPGIVHDYDILQVVNELRAAGAEAISVNGNRVTGFTPIRCVGPVIYVNGQPVAAPFRISAVGSPDTLKSAIEMPGGIVEKLSALVGVRVKRVGDLKLPAAENLPKMQHAKAATS
jgi:uncharacterized protein YlxW (UPF0749 family)